MHVTVHGEARVDHCFPRLRFSRGFDARLSRRPDEPHAFVLPDVAALDDDARRALEIETRRLRLSVTALHQVGVIGQDPLGGGQAGPHRAEKLRIARPERPARLAKRVVGPELRPSCRGLSRALGIGFA